MRAAFGVAAVLVLSGASHAFAQEAAFDEAFCKNPPVRGDNEYQYRVGMAFWNTRCKDALANKTATGSAGAVADCDRPKFREGDVPWNYDLAMTYWRDACENAN